MQPPVRRIELPWGGTAHYHSHLGVSRKRLLPAAFHGLGLARAGLHLPLAWAPPTARHRALWRTLLELKPDVVVADETWLAPYAAFAPARCRVVHTHNLESAASREFAATGANSAHHRRMARRYAQVERELLPRVDQVWGVREEDLDAYAAAGVARSALRLVPNAVPDAAFHPAPAPGEAGLGLFVGSLWHPPNLAAAQALADLAQALARRGVAARLVVAGRGAPPELVARAEGIPSFELAGFVEDLPALLRRAAVVVVPMRGGGGTKLKLIEAMAAGRPILTTPEGAAGLGLEDGAHAWILPLGDAFLDTLAELLARPEAHLAMGLRAQALARERYSLKALRDAVGRALSELGFSKSAG
ncbi:MAG TPA: glycosyltransferase family 4 protein [Holophagaceae bacterium]|nr:glycosyltransferase family 4 protein [Holophagaceae bacterium]